MRALHIVAIGFAVIMLLLTARNYLKHRKLAPTLLWAVVWVGTIIATLLFDRLKVYTEAINVRVFDFLVVLAFLLTFAVLYRLYGKLELLGNKMEEIVQAIALRDAGVKSAAVQRKRGKR